MPPLSPSDLPPNPPPYDGKSKLLVLAYPMTEDHILWWARKHKIPQQSSYDDIGWAIHKMRMLIPEECRMGTVRIENGGTEFSWSFVTNREKDLKLAGNLEFINKVKKIIGAKGAPQWYVLGYSSRDY